MNSKLRESYSFFRGQTGCVGRDAQVSIQLARAELRAEADGLTHEWQEDNEINVHEGCENHPHFGCILRGPDGENLASLWSICFDEDWPTGWYKRFVEAELACEHYANEAHTSACMHL